jgi:hypothetical protein
MQTSGMLLASPFVVHLEDPCLFTSPKLHKSIT